MTTREAAHELARHRWQKAYVGPARHGLLRRVACLDAQFATPRLVDEFMQMTVAECRAFVHDIQRWKVSATK